MLGWQGITENEYLKPKCDGGEVETTGMKFVQRKGNEQIFCRVTRKARVFTLIARIETHHPHENSIDVYHADVLRRFHGKFAALQPRKLPIHTNQSSV
jgi:hypothetical protein